jgi:hypothetical protein
MLFIVVPKGDSIIRHGAKMSDSLLQPGSDGECAI